MIEILTSSGEINRLENTSAISINRNDIIAVQFLDYDEEEIEWVKEAFDIDLTIMNNIEDIEISSHFDENKHQASFHFSLPYYSRKNRMVEESFFVVLTDDRLFTFMSASLSRYLREAYSSKFNLRRQRSTTIRELFRFQIEFIADYYADVTQNLAKRVKNMAARVLIKKEFTENDLDLITQLNFNNLLIKESMNEYIRILTLFKKSVKESKINMREKIDSELNDLSAVSDYIQFNFDRLDDLKENISNKIDLEQNRIFKILTIVTVCIAMPTLIAGIYGMNFRVMPELNWKYGYPFALGAMLLSVIIPVVYFNRKKWL